MIPLSSHSRIILLLASLASLSRILISRKPLRTPSDNRRASALHFNNAGQAAKKWSLFETIRKMKSLLKFNTGFGVNERVLAGVVFIVLVHDFDDVRRFVPLERKTMGEWRRYSPLQHYCRLSLTGKCAIASRETRIASGQQKKGTADAILLAVECQCWLSSHRFPFFSCAFRGENKGKKSLKKVTYFGLRKTARKSWRQINYCFLETCVF